MKVLIIYLSPYNGNSSSAKRMLGMTKGIIELGCETTLLTTKIKNKELPEDYAFLNKLKIVSVEEIEQTGESFGTNRENADTIKSRIKQLIAKYYRMIRIYGHTETLAKKINIDEVGGKKYDVIISVSDPKSSHIALATLINQGLKANKIIEYWGDPLYGDITLQTVYSDRTLKKREKKMLSLADSIIYTSPFTVTKEQEIFPEYSDIMHFVPTASPDPKKEPELVAQDDNGHYSVGYFGAYHAQTRNIIPLYEAFFSDERQEDVLTIIGDSDFKLSDTPNIKVYPRCETTQFEELSDLLVCILNKNGTQLPGKLYYCASSYKAVMVIVDGDEREKMISFLKSFDRFYICNNDKDEINTCINEIKKDRKKWSPSITLKETNVATRILGS